MEVETKHYADGSIVTGAAPLPAVSPREQEAIERETRKRIRAAKDMDEGRGHRRRG